MTADQVFPFFFAVWILLGVSGFILFYVKRDAAFKHKYFPWYVCLAGALFLGFVAASGAPFTILAFMAPFIALITFLNLRGTQFCDACGRTIIQQMPFSRPEFCSKCGASLRGPSGPPRA
jgi:hypothetical protein